MKQLTLLVLTLVWNVFTAQTITVIDKITRQSLPGAIVQQLHGKRAVLTNSNGQFLQEEFQATDTVLISIMGYVPRLVRIADIKPIVEMIEGSVSLGEVTIEATGANQERFVAPNRVEKLNMNEVAFQNPQTTADLLGTSGYAFIQKSQLGGGSPMLRGMATNRVLLVVDGVRMNNAIFRSGNLQNVISLDANALDATEIIFGPGSVMYGSDAIGGVMNFSTLHPIWADSMRPLRIKSNVLVRSSSANREMTAHADVKIGFRKWAFVSSFTYSDYGDLRSGTKGGVNYFYRPNYVETIDNKDYMVANPDSSLQKGSAYSQQNFMQKIAYRHNNFLSVEYGLHVSQTSAYNRYDRLYVMQTAGPYKNKLRWAEWYYGPQKWNMNNLKLLYTKKNLVFDVLKITAALQNFEESRYDREFMVRELRMQKETVRASSGNFDFIKSISGKILLGYGVEAVHNRVGSVANLTHVVSKEQVGTVTRYPNGSTWQSYGAYATIRWQAEKKLVFSAGLRYSVYRIDATFDTTYFEFPFSKTVMKNGTLNGSVGFVYLPQQNWKLYLNAATGFRAPNIDDMGKVFESTPGYLVVPNPNLKPEQAYNIEVGTIKSLRRFLKADAAAYYTIINDAMERMNYTFNGQSTIRYQGNKSTIQAVQNVSKAWVYGLQLGIELAYRGFGIKSTFSYQHGKEQSADSLVYYPLRHAAPTFGSTHLTYLMKWFKFDFYAVYNGRMDYEDLALTERVNTSYAKDYSVDPKGRNYTAAWYTLNFKLAYYPFSALAVTAGVENIFDVLYRPYSSGINAPGRNYLIAIKYLFDKKKKQSRF